MAIRESQHQKHQGKKGGKFLSVLCRHVGTLVLTLVIVSALLLMIPRFLDYEVFSIVSESMEPSIPLGSLVYVKPSSPDSILPEDIIAFWRDGAAVAHRVTENRAEEGCFITKGDANPIEDIYPVSYSDLIGRVILHIPVLGRLMLLYVSNEGKLYLALIAISGTFLSVLGSSMQRRQKVKEERNGQ